MSAGFRHCLIVLTFSAILAPGLTPCQGDFESTGVQKFDDAVRQAVEFLKSKPPVTAPEIERQPLISYALLKAGESTDSPMVSAGIQTATRRAQYQEYVGYNGIYLCGIDAMLLAELKRPELVAAIQSIADHLESIQKPDGSWSDRQDQPGDVSMTQYALLALWAAERAGCQVSLSGLEDASDWLSANKNSDSGWGYRPGHQVGFGKGASTHNMTMAAAGTLSIVRLLIHGDRASGGRSGDDRPKKKFGVLEPEAEPESTEKKALPDDYRPRSSSGELDRLVDGGFRWLEDRPQSMGSKYFYYTLERAASLNARSDNWYEHYGNMLLTFKAENGRFPDPNGDDVGTAFAVLFFMRSTERIMDAYGRGRMRGARDLLSLINPDSKKKAEDIGPLDDLLAAMAEQDFASIDVTPDDLVNKIQFGSRDELIGQVDKLRLLTGHSDAKKRQIAYWALGRTGDFSLIPLMLEGLKDPSIDVNVEAILALRSISRRPRGFGMTLDPLGQLAKNADEATRLAKVNAWRTECYRAWKTWYNRVRPWEERDGLDEYLPGDGAAR